VHTLLFTGTPCQINAQDERGNTPLTLAQFANREPVVELLSVDHMDHLDRMEPVVELLSSFADAIVGQTLSVENYGRGLVKQYSQQRHQHRMHFESRGNGWTTWITLIEHKSRPGARAESFRVLADVSNMPIAPSGLLSFRF
jgi:hypothetical protein